MLLSQREGGQGGLGGDGNDDDDWVCEALAAEFFAEAYRQDVPAFEMVFIHEQLSNSPSNVWSSDDRERRNDAMWRRIHRVLRRRRNGGWVDAWAGGSVGGIGRRRWRVRASVRAVCVGCACKRQRESAMHVHIRRLELTWPPARL